MSMVVVAKNKTMNFNMKHSELLWEANGGIRNLGWARLVTKFKNFRNFTTKLYNDRSFYGKILPEHGFIEGFIFTKVNTPEDIYERVSREYFTIIRDDTNEKANLSPAVLSVLGQNGIYVNNNYISKGSSVILKTGDSIKLNTHEMLFQFFDDREFESKTIPDCILRKYHMNSSIGNGGQSSSVRLIHHKRTQDKFAMKIISRDRYTSESFDSHAKRLEHMTNEIEIMRKLQHHNVIKFVEAYDNHRDLFIIMELADQGNFLEYIQLFPGKYLPESEAKFCCFQICKGLQHIHKLKIAHRDLKVENIFVMKMSVGDRAEMVLKIGDFGYSKSIADHLLTQIGTKYYLPPEIKNLCGEYTFKADIWTLGCIFYCCISGSYPFHENYGSSLSQQILNAELNFDYHDQWNIVSPTVKNMIRGMLQVNPENRPTADFILNQAKWFKDDKAHNQRVKNLYASFDDDLTGRMNSFSLDPPAAKKKRIG